jgi:hypothetical protein
LLALLHQIALGPLAVIGQISGRTLPALFQGGKFARISGQVIVRPLMHHGYLL